MSKNWQERVYVERRELMNKYNLLCHFMLTAYLPREQMGLLAQQKAIMYEYIAILDLRINSWGS